MVRPIGCALLLHAMRAVDGTLDAAGRATFTLLAVGRLDAAGTAAFTLFAVGRDAHVGLPLHGEHHVSDALAAASVAFGLGTDVGKSADALSRAAQEASARMEVTDRPDHVRVINDAPGAQGPAIERLRRRRSTCKASSGRLRQVRRFGRGHRPWPALGHRPGGADQDDVSPFERREGSAGGPGARRCHL
ncbi:hypothetical protein [Streptomyces sp. NPDC046182]|uniref:hypothetical protein n=1 Tax=Streptomyces sp. NPDC046182 TaxID=3154601 RepID=UPI00340D07AA